MPFDGEFIHWINFLPTSPSNPARAPYTENLMDFDTGEICLDQVKVEAFCGFVVGNLGPKALSLSSQSDNLETEVRHWAPDVEQLTFRHRLIYEIK